MTTARASDAYPAPMLDALHRAFSLGELFIPCPQAGKILPSTLRLQFYGLIAALRREGKSELANSLGFYTQSEPPGLWIKLKDRSAFGNLVAAALASNEAPPDGENPPSGELESPEAAFKRLFGEN